MDDNACLACGGRDYADWNRVIQTMSNLRRTRGMSRVIVGGASGADSLAEKWARLAGLPVNVYKAEWNKYGRAAGPKRNTRMLKEGQPRYVVAFPGGRGTDDMIRQAEAAGIEVIKVKQSIDRLCPHGLVLADNICGPCSEGRPNSSTAQREVSK